MTVGWYVHHHGSGHRSRLLATLPHLQDVTVLSSLPRPADVACPWIALPLDTDGEGRDADAAGTLHWAPLDSAGLRDRMARISAWIAAARPAAMVVDVSVEVALLARLHGVPTVVVLQRGLRTDAPHQLAFAQAAALIAPWSPAAHLDDDGPAVGRITFTGAISRFDGAPLPAAATDDVLVLVGSGGHQLSGDDVVAAAAATPGRRWRVAGALRVEADGVEDHGPDADVRALVAGSGVVVGTAGGNVVAEVAALRRPLICLPQRRPFAEQQRQGEVLRRLGLAIVREQWPDAGEWPLLLDEAAGHDPARWERLHDGAGGRRLAQAVRAVAA